MDRFCTSSQGVCANCGGRGHSFRECDLPITSFGVVCYRRTQEGLQYLLVQRKDSLCYVEFIRGKYELTKRNYIQRLLSNMTHEERARLLTMSFDELWSCFWQDEHCNSNVREFAASKAKFEQLRCGYGLRVAPDHVLEDNVDLAGLIEASAPGYESSEWGFPKGRRNFDETDNQCAMREFSEETGLTIGDVVLLRPTRTFEEVFRGSNDVMYRHCYYVARAVAKDLFSGGEGSAPPRPISSHQLREIKRAAWFSRDEVLARIRQENVERREMFKRIHVFVQGT